MRPLLAKVKPKSGYANVLHLMLLCALPLVLFVLVQLQKGFDLPIIQVGFSLVVLSKWRMFALRPRFWPANVRANAVDLMVGLSIVVFMVHSGSTFFQLALAILYAVWLIFVKPASGLLMTSTQAFVGQLFALLAVYIAWSSAPLFALTLMTGLLCFLAARHFFEGFDEPYEKLLAYVWGYFGASIAWLLGHMLIGYPYHGGSGPIAQPVLFLTAIGYGVSVLYYFQHRDRLSKNLRREVLVAVVLIALALTISLYQDTRHLIA